jgi:hypothetical protein
VDVAEFGRRLEAMLDRIPAPLLRDLNGGITVSEEARRRRDDPPGVFVLGEYVTDPHLGALIVLYHGSFARLYGGEPPSVWEREMWEALRHELRHHVEGLAGVADLDAEDAAELERMRRESGPARYRPRAPLPRRRP